MYGITLRYSYLLKGLLSYLDFKVSGSVEMDAPSLWLVVLCTHDDG